MPLRKSRTPTAEQLDTLAEVTPADIARAQEKWRKAFTGRRTALRSLLDATTDDAGPADGPIADPS